ncbi:MAG TPA: Holliday junction branch migration protein RuvA [Candidatus Paceibacterota bacterium]
MIGKLSGIFAGTTSDDSILIDVRGVGYVVHTPKVDETPAEGSPLELYIHTAVRDDAIDLYGFPSRGALQFFKLLMSVSGVGPKTALAIMGSADIPSLRNAIARGDVAALTKLYGIGKKSAERLVVELKDKVLKEVDASETGAIVQDSAQDSDLLEALEALGYSTAQSRRAIRETPNTGGDMRERLAAILKQLGTPR